MSSERHFLHLMGFSGALILLHQGLDLYASAGAADAGTPSGRLGIVAVIWSRSPVLLAADVLLVIAALRLIRPRVLAALAGAHLVLCLTVLLAAPFFLTDAGRVTGNIALPELTSFRITVSRILVALIVVGVAAGVTGVSLLQASRGQAKTA